MKIEAGVGEAYVDGGASIHLTGNIKLVKYFIDRRVAGPNDYVMMNAHAERVKCYGDLQLRVRCAKTGRVEEMTLRNVAFVPNSRFTLVSQTKYLADLAKETGRKRPCVKGYEDQGTVPLAKGSVVADTKNGLYRLRLADRVKEEGSKPSKNGEVALATTAEAVEPEGPDKENDGHTWAEVVLAKARAAVRAEHEKFGHSLSLKNYQKWLREGKVQVQDKFVREAVLQMRAADVPCDHCALAAVTKKAPSKKEGTNREGRWWCDFGVNLPRSRRGHRVVSCLVAPNGKGVFLASHKGRTKEEFLEYLQENLALHERRAGERCKVLAGDLEGAFKSTQTKKWLGQRGTEVFHTPGESNNAAEVHLRWAQDRARASLNSSRLPDRFFIDAMFAANDCADKVPGADGFSRAERRGESPRLDKQVPFGQPAVAYVDPAGRSKGDNRGRLCRLLGLRQDGTGYIAYDMKKKSVFSTQNIRLLAGAGKQAADAPGEAPAVQSAEEKEQVAEQQRQIAEEKEQAAGQQRQISEEGEAQGAPNPQEDGDGSEPDNDGAPARPQRVRGRPDTFSPTMFDDAKEVEKQLQEQAGSAQVTGTGYVEAQRHADNALKGFVPRTDQEADTCDERAYWKAARDVENANLSESGSLKEIQIGPAEIIGGRRVGRKLRGRTVINSKYVYDKQLLDAEDERAGPTIRVTESGQKLRYKARLVGLGYQQRPSDYAETYAATPQIAAVRMVLALGLLLGWEASQLDVRAAFLQAHLPPEERIYMIPPSGEAGIVWEVMRSLYGLRQAAYRWSEDVSKTLQREGFEKLDADTCVYTHRDKEGKIVCVIALHVDDMLLVADGGVRKELEGKLMKNYEMTKSDARWFLKMKVEYAKDGSSVTLSQPLYAEEIVKTAKMVGCNPVSTPMEVLPTEETGPMSPEDAAFMQDKDYGGVVGMLSHYTIQTRPDLALAVAQLQRFTKDPRRQHWLAAMRVVKYVSGTKNYGLRFVRDSVAEVVGYSDSDWAGEVEGRKSTSGFVFLFMGAAIAWKSRKQPSVARSTAEAELIALDLAVREALWLRKMCAGLDVNLTPEGGAPTITVFEDNEACLNIAKGSRWSAETKHVDVKYFAVREDVIEGRVSVKRVATAENVSDMFTKPLGRLKFEQFRTMMGCVPVG